MSLTVFANISLIFIKLLHLRSLCSCLVTMPPKKDSEDEARLQADPHHMPASKATGDEWLLECILTTVADLGVCRSRQGSEAMQKSCEMWHDVAATVQAAAKARQERFREDYLRNLRSGQTKESERQASEGKKGRAEKKPVLHRIKWEVSGEYCRQTFIKTKSDYQALAQRYKLSRCAAAQPSPQHT
jgi:hypothetical protein